ncbi:MAG: hypothetical protein HQL27_01615 [Candidatus Omnitrophica bacterium]|nr:hypothetical protein [Candidatus Omnitrophota bacterium]
MSFLAIKNKFLRFIAVLAIMLSANGCIYIVVGGIGVLGGYVVSPDTVEGMTENDLNYVWETIVEVASIMGTIQDQSEEGGLLKANIQGSKITVTVSRINETTTRLTVKARKSLFPKITLAQDVFVKIMSRLKN